MLVAQAAFAAEKFLGRSIPAEAIEETLGEITRQCTNIVLIGMPGCGKSTVGKILAELNGRELVDTDAMVETRTGRSIPTIFAEDGEEIFRRLEAEAVAEAG